MDKENLEFKKLVSEIDKNQAETRLTNKRIKWYEVVLAAAIGAIVATLIARL